LGERENTSEDKIYIVFLKM